VNDFLIKKHKVGLSCKALVIAEIAQAHDGSLGTAHAYIDAIADAGADAVKFQTHIAAAESTPSEPWRVKFSRQDTTRYEYWQRMEFTQEQWAGLYQHAVDRDLIFISSPFSIQAVDLLRQTGIDAWKIASGEVGNTVLLQNIAKTGLPVLISSGMSPVSETDGAVKFLQNRNVPFTVFQCSSFYPCPPEKTGLNMLSFFRDRYQCPVGLSDHSGTVYPSFAAVSLGVQMLEVHVTFSRQMFGPDVASSVTMDEFKHLVEGVRFIEAMKDNPVDKESMAQELQPMRELFTKSIVATGELESGTILEARHLTVKKPGTGFAPEKLPELIGSRLVKNVKKDQIIIDEDIEWNIR